MPERWLQVKGDPSVRAFLFDQKRVQSLFDEHIDHIMHVMHELLTRKGVFHVKAHFSSSQLTCWFYDNPFSYRVYVREQVTDPDFLPRVSEAERSKLLINSIYVFGMERVLNLLLLEGLHSNPEKALARLEPDDPVRAVYLAYIEAELAQRADDLQSSDTPSTLRQAVSRLKNLGG